MLQEKNSLYWKRIGLTQVCCLTPQAIEHFMVIISDLKIQALRKFNFTASEASLFYHVRQLSCIAFLMKSKLYLSIMLHCIILMHIPAKIFLNTWSSYKPYLNWNKTITCFKHNNIKCRRLMNDWNFPTFKFPKGCIKILERTIFSICHCYFNIQMCHNFHDYDTF